jgi:cephalosporin hydroxylase
MMVFRFRSTHISPSHCQNRDVSPINKRIHAQSAATATLTVARRWARPKVERIAHSSFKDFAMKIGSRAIGYDHPPLVIAEIGINHGGSLEVAKEMVRLAAASGCECVKHQTHILEDEMTDEAKQIFPPNADVSIWEVMARCALSKDDEIAL